MSDLMYIPVLTAINHIQYQPRHLERNEGLIIFGQNFKIPTKVAHFKMQWPDSGGRRQHFRRALLIGFSKSYKPHTNERDVPTLPYRHIKCESKRGREGTLGHRIHYEPNRPKNIQKLFRLISVCTGKEI